MIDVTTLNVADRQGGPAVPLTLPGLLQARAQKAPDAPLFRCGTVRRSAREMIDAVERCAGLLRRLGVDHGDRVVLMASNRTELLDLICASAWIGAVAVPINIAARGQQLHHILENSQANLMVVESDCLEYLEALPDVGTLKQILLLDDLDRASTLEIRVDLLPDVTEPVQPVDVSLSDPAAILYTSGTTGISKGVVCPHGQFYWWGLNVSRQVELTEDDVLYTCLPLFHTNALNAFSQALVCGAEYVLGPRFSASRFWTDVASAGATFTYLLGAMVSILAGRAPTEADRTHSVRAALAPASPPGILYEFQERFGVVLIDGYGSTETNAVISASRSQQRPGYMGWVQEGFQARVVDECSLPVPTGQPGELLVRSEQPHSFATGYFGMPEATVEAWQDLWFHTGDRVVIEDDGWVRFVDRIKDVIRRRGENISSVEVETVLLAHADVADAAVYAVDSELGESEVMAALVPVPGVKLDLENLVEFCRPRLAYFAIPRFFLTCSELPLTENGKVRKTVLQSWGTENADWDREA